MKESRPLGDLMAISSGRRAPQPIDLRAILVTLRKYKWLITLVGVIATLLVALAVSLLTPIYKSSVTLLFEDSQSETGFESQGSEFGNRTAGGGVNLATQLEVIKSRALAKRVATQEKLAEHWEYNSSLPTPLTEPSGLLRTLRRFISSEPTVVDQPEEKENGNAVSLKVTEGVVSRLLGRTSAVLLRNTDIVRITVKSADPELAARIANGYGLALQNYYQIQSTSRDSAAKEFLGKKL